MGEMDLGRERLRELEIEVGGDEGREGEMEGRKERGRRKR